MTTKGDRLISDVRAASNLVGIVLLVGMAVLGAVLVVILGAGALDETEQQSRLQSAEQGLQDVSSRLGELKVGSGQQRTSFTLPENMGGDARVSTTTSVRLTANGNPSCTTGSIDIGTIRYENDDGDVVGYEAGGVWRKSGQGGSWMVQSPDIEYRNGRLGMSMSQMSGSISSGTIDATVNRTMSQRMNANITLAMFANRTVSELQAGEPHSLACSPENVSTIQVSISDSPFAGAWHSYATRNFDDRRVTVEDRQRPQAGGTVNISFKLGQTTEPEYVVRDLDAPNSARDTDDVVVDAVIENVGDLNGSQSVKLRLVNVTADPNQTVEATPYAATETDLGGGENTTVGFTIDSEDLENDPHKYRNYSIRVETDDDSAQRGMLVGDGVPADFHVSAMTLPTGVDIGESFDVTAAITNDGGMPANDTIEFRFNGSDAPTDTVDVTGLKGGETTTVTFTETVFDTGTFPVNVSVRNPDDIDQWRQDQVNIGEKPNYRVTDTTTPSSVSANSAFYVNATIRNVGETDGDEDIDVFVRNATTGATVDDETVTKAIPGTFSVTDGGVATVNWSVDSGISTPGRYEYVVQTPNETRVGNLFVGSVDAAYFLVTEATPASKPVEQGGELEIEATVNNTGTETETQTVDYYFDDDPVWTGTSVTLTPGESKDLPPIVHDIPDDKAPGWYNFTVETNNNSLKGQVKIVENLSDVDFGGGDGTTISVNQSITARLEVLGTELSGLRYPCIAWYGRYCIERSDTPESIGRGPVNMAIYTDNESAPKEYHYVWGEETDLNTPSRYEDQIDGADYLSQTITVTATEDSPTNVSVFASSYRCEEEEETDIYTSVDGVDEDLPQELCTDRKDTRWIAINEENNPSNLVILEDGERVPAYGQAGREQRDVREILGEKITDDGYLQLDGDQRVLLYELSEENAEPENARTDNDDPDYNDAVVLFEVVEEETTVSAPGDPDVRINDTSGPAQVNPINNEAFEVELWNRGAGDGTDHLELWIDGTRYENRSVALDPGESVTETVDVPDGLAAGRHDVQFRLGSDPDNKTANRNIYVGTSSNPYFLPNAAEYDRLVRPGEVVTVDTSVVNVGAKSDTQDVTAEITSASGDISGMTGATRTWAALTLAPSEERSRAFTFTPSGEGTMTIEVSTPENGSFEVDVAVREPRFDVTRAVVGDRIYSDGQTVVSSNLERITAEVTNPVAIEETQDVRFEMDHDNDGTLELIDRKSDLTLDGETALPSFELGEYSNQTGVYDYRIVPDEGETLSGEIQIANSDPASPENSTSDPERISIDMNMIQLG